MKRHLPLALTLATALVSALASAQDAFDVHVANIQILQNKAVQTELKVTEAQRKRMNVHAEAHGKRVQAYGAELQKAGKKPENMPNPDPKLIGYFDQLKQKVVKELSAAQLKRLREITLQSVGVAGFLDDKVAKRLGFTAAQNTRLRKLFTDGRSEMAKIEREAADRILKPYQNRQPKSQEEATQLRQEIGQKMEAAIGGQLRARGAKVETDMNAVLTAKQRADWAALKGKAFKPK